MDMHKGFTLLELLVAMAITAILLQSAVPSFNDIYARNLSQTTTYEIINIHNFARGFAITHKQTLTLCGSDNGHDCIKTWHNYLLLFHDDNSDKTATDNEIVQKHQFPENKLSIKTRSSLGQTTINYKASGMLTNAGSFIICPINKNPKLAARATWNWGGKMYQARDVNGDGFIEDTDGKPIVCP